MRHLSVFVSALLLVSACVPQNSANTSYTYAQAQRAPTAVAGASSPMPAPATSAEAATSVPVKKVVKVALLLPLTGRNADLGKAMQDAAAVSLFDKYARLSLNQQATKVELLPIDSGDSPELARKAMQQAMTLDVELVIGPVFGDATEAAGPVAATRHIPVLSFSNNRARGNIPGTYLMGFSPLEQALRVVRYAVENNKKRIAVLVPQSPLGEEVLAAARIVAKESGKVTLVEAQYAPQGVGMEAAIAKLAPSGGGAPQFDALLLAETGSPLQSLLRALSARGITPSNTQLMGTGMWDDAALLAHTNLDGAWLASSPPDAISQFEARFRSTYDYTPPRITSLAYDAVALAITLAASGRGFTPETLTTSRGFVGPANGIFRLRDAATAERGLAVLQVQGGGLRVISPAPKGFTGN